MAEEKTPLIWKFEAGSSVFEPVVSEGVVYFGSENGELYALDINTGDIKWKKRIEHFDFYPVVSNGLLYFWEYGDNKSYKFCALEPVTGEEKWNFQTQYSGPFTVMADMVLAGRGFTNADNGADQSELVAINCNNGELKWKFIPDPYMYDDEFYQSRFSVSSKPMLSNETIYFGTSDNYLFALDNAAGEEKWNFSDDYAPHMEEAVFGKKVPCNSIYTAPIVEEGLVCFASGNLLYGIDIKTSNDFGFGDETWKYEAESTIKRTLAVSEGIVFFCSDNNILYAVGIKDGQEKWKSKFLGYISTPTVSMGMVYIGSDDKHLYGLDIKTGKEKLKFETGGIVSTPAVSKRVVYFGSDHHLYALQIPE